MPDIVRSKSSDKVAGNKCKSCVGGVVVVVGFIAFAVGIKNLTDNASGGECTLLLPHRCEKNIVKHKGGDEEKYTLTYDAKFDPDRPGASELTCTWRGQSWGHENFQSVTTRMRLCEQAAALMDTAGAQTCKIPDEDRPDDCEAGAVADHTILGIVLLVVGSCVVIPIFLLCCWFCFGLVVDCCPSAIRCCPTKMWRLWVEVNGDVNDEPPGDSAAIGNQQN